MSALALPGLPNLGQRLRAQGRSRTNSIDRGVFDTLKRRRETEANPPDLHEARARVDALRGTMDLDALRDAAIDEAVAALAIVVRLPPRDLLDSP